MTATTHPDSPVSPYPQGKRLPIIEIVWPVDWTAQEADTLIETLQQSGDSTVAALLADLITRAGFELSGPTDHRAAEHGEPVWVCNAREALAHYHSTNTTTPQF